jgi:hypothetical protein
MAIKLPEGIAIGLHRQFHGIHSMHGGVLQTDTYIFCVRITNNVPGT